MIYRAVLTNNRYRDTATNCEQLYLDSLAAYAQEENDRVTRQVQGAQAEVVVLEKARAFGMAALTATEKETVLRLLANS